MVQFIVIRHSVELAALHLSKRWLIPLTRFCVARPVTLPFPSAVFTSKLRSVRTENKELSVSTGQDTVPIFVCDVVPV